MNNDPEPPSVMHVRVVSGHGGGPDKTILNSPRFLPEFGYRSVCVYLRDPTDRGYSVLESRAAEKRATLESVDDFGLADWGIIRRVRELVRVYRPAIWHGHDYKSNLLGLMVRPGAAGGTRPTAKPLRLVTTVHGWVQKTWKTPLYYFVDRQCLRRYERVVCVSSDLVKDCRRLGVPDARLSLIDNAIALDDYEIELSPAEARTRLGLQPQRPLVAAVGRLSAEKGFDLLIDAVAELARGGVDVGLAIAGSRSEHARLATHIQRTGLADRIKLLGFCEDPRVLYQAADLFVLSSIREGLPNVLLEAMAMRTPVIATRIAGVPDLIVDGESGRLIDPGDPASLREAIRALLEDKAARQRLASGGRRTIEERFSFRERMRKMAAVYDSTRSTTIRTTTIHATTIRATRRPRLPDTAWLDRGAASPNGVLSALPFTESRFNGSRFA